MIVVVVIIIVGVRVPVHDDSLPYKHLHLDVVPVHVAVGCRRERGVIDIGVSGQLDQLQQGTVCEGELSNLGKCVVDLNALQALASVESPIFNDFSRARQLYSLETAVVERRISDLLNSLRENELRQRSALEESSLPYHPQFPTHSNLLQVLAASECRRRHLFEAIRDDDLRHVRSLVELTLHAKVRHRRTPLHLLAELS
mmetsp:Transcript_26376/g.52620  ORF Transcript_26376/g.52620 Transcript_26376/m.52620 type:complete len:200 (+) Transcript_26376:58-657(+)